MIEKKEFSTKSIELFKNNNNIKNESNRIYPENKSNNATTNSSTLKYEKK